MRYEVCVFFIIRWKNYNMVEVLVKGIVLLSKLLVLLKFIFLKYIYCHLPYSQSGSGDGEAGIPPRPDGEAGVPGAPPLIFGRSWD